MSYDEQPTRRIPAQPVAPADPAYAPVDPHARIAPDAVWMEDVSARLRSLRTALAVVGTLAALALGLAAWALLDREEGDGRGASAQRVEQLEDRVDRFEDRLDNRATKASVAELGREQQQLAEQVEQAQAAAGEDGGGEQAAQEVEELRGELQALAQRVDELAQQPAEEEGATTP